MSRTIQVASSSMSGVALRRQMGSICGSRGLLQGMRLLILALSIGSAYSVSSEMSIRQSDETKSSQDLMHFQSEKGYARVLPLKAGEVNSSRLLMERNRRTLLGDARMPLHDDLLTKGYYTSTLSIGTPAHDFALIVDTGSTITYVPCSSCTHCGPHQDAAFKPADSSTYEAIPCTSTICDTGLCGENKVCKYRRQYAEASTSSGLLGKDTFGFGDQNKMGNPKLLFGCENDETGDLFFQKADGIMGLGRGTLSIVNQLVQEKAMADTFSLCYGGMDEVGGNMIMGDFPNPPGMVFTPSDPTRSPYYNVELKQIKVAGKALPVDASVFNAKYGTVLDSGTTYAYLPEKAYNQFKRAVMAQLKNLVAVKGPDPQYPDFCFKGAGTDPAKLGEFFPSVEFVFGGSTLQLQPENYLFNHTQISGAYCLGVFKNENDHTTLLGGILVRNMLVKYDRANQQIGFWRTNCTNLWTELTDAQENKIPPPPPSPPPPPPVAAAIPPSPAPISVEVSAPPPEVSTVGPITDEHIGGLELNISFNANVTTFDSLSSAFKEDMARELQLEPHQVRLVGVQDHGSDVAVTCAVSPVSRTSLSGTKVKNIIVRLEQHQVQFREDFGGYHLNNWRLIPEKETSWWGSNLKLVVGMFVFFAVLCLVIVALWLTRRARDRSQKMKYTAIDPLGYNASQQL